jgi:CheY-like chemotaxis protein
VTQNLETIFTVSQRAAKLVQQIVDFGRRSTIKTRPMDLVSFTKGVSDVLRRTLPENIHLTLAMGLEEYAASLTVEADPTCIQQALMNLATNARDAMLPKGGGELHIGLSRVTLKPGEKPPGLTPGRTVTAIRAPPGEWICLTVSDTGTGMTKETQTHLFEPFFTTKKPGAGSGLGLAQVYSIIKQHKGHIGVETAAGEGSTFRVYLPAYVKKVEEVETKEPAALLQGKGETILLVEDETRLRKAMREVLEALDYRVLTAANGQEALEIYRAVEVCPEQGRRVDLVLADLVMPEMGGKQLIRELKQEDPDLKVLAITGYVMEADQQELKEAGFLDVIRKPFDTSRLARMIRRALG